MSRQIAHRGPDGSGTWISASRHVGLAHRRLAIIDLSDAAGQPLSNEDHTVQVVFNGEIYNHESIREELEKLGTHAWKTDHSDTEVIVHAYEEWGIECLEKFRGMFSIALWDERKQELWLIRDRMGIKPLYYSIHHGRLTFASEIKALLADPLQQRGIDELSLFHYLSFLAVPAPHTLFEGIHKVPAGCWLRCKPDGFTEIRRYYEILEHVTPFSDQDEEVVAEQLLQELRESVALHKASDVPVGVFLSGGIDSSTNAALFSETENSQVRTFSIGYHSSEKEYPDELPFARKMADHIHAQHHEKHLAREEAARLLDHLFWAQDEPIADPVCIPTYFVSKLARDTGIKVCQVGEGADELFCGYPSWGKKLKTAYRLKNPLFLGAALSAASLAKLFFAPHSGKREMLTRLKHGQPLFWGNAEAIADQAKKVLLSPSALKRIGNITSWEAIRPIYERFEAFPRNGSKLNWMTYLDLNLRLPELLLMRVDKMSMAVSLETRVPFLDHKLAEFALGMREDLKFRQGTPKYILRKAVTNLLPHELLSRPKQGFGLPLDQWISEGLTKDFDIGLNQFCRDSDLLDKEAALRIHRSNRIREKWVLFNLFKWHQIYFR